MTEAIKETFKENIDQGLGLQSLEKKKPMVLKISVTIIRSLTSNLLNTSYVLLLFLVGDT